MSVYALLTEKQTFLDANGNELAGGKLFVYLAGTTTKTTSCTETDGVTPNSNPIVLNSRGEVPSGLYVAGGATYKLVLAPATDTDPPTSPIWTRDNLAAYNDVSVSTTLSQWITSAYTVTYSNATTFTVAGDVTATYQIGRRVRATIGSGNLYGTIQSSAFSLGVTTVTVTWDSGSMDASLTAVDYALLTSADPSVPELTDNVWRVVDNADRTKKLAVELGNFTTATTRTLTLQNKSGTLPVLADMTAPYNAALAASVNANALTVSLKTLAGTDASAGDPVYIPFRSATITTGTPVVRTVTGALSLTAPQGATLGFAGSTNGRLHVYAVDNAGTVTLAVYRAESSGSVVPLDEMSLVSTTLMDTASDSAQVPYSAAAHTNVIVSYLGYIQIAPGATPGDWSASPTVVSTYRPGARKPGDIVASSVTSTSSMSTFGAGVGETIPLDNTIPQNTEGTQILSLAVTPRSTLNIMRIDAVAYMTANSGVHVIMALFSGGANALTAMTVLQGNANTGAFPLRHQVAAGATSITYSLRAGPATAATVTLNGQGGAALFGGVFLSSLAVSEIWS